MDKYIESLKLAVEGRHNCKAEYDDRYYYHFDKSSGKVSFEGVIYTFDLEGHTEAKTAYAWSEGSDKVYAVLKIDPVETALDAVASTGDYGDIE